MTERKRGRERERGREGETRGDKISVKDVDGQRSCVRSRHLCTQPQNARTITRAHAPTRPPTHTHTRTSARRHARKVPEADGASVELSSTLQISRVKLAARGGAWHMWGYVVVASFGPHLRHFFERDRGRVGLDAHLVQDPRVCAPRSERRRRGSSRARTHAPRAAHDDGRQRRRGRSRQCVCESILHRCCWASMLLCQAGRCVAPHPRLRGSQRGRGGGTLRWAEEGDRGGGGGARTSTAARA